MYKIQDEMMASLPEDRRQRIEERSKQIIEFLKSEQAVMRTERGQKVDEYIKNLRDNDRL